MIDGTAGPTDDAAVPTDDTEVPNDDSAVAPADAQTPADAEPAPVWPGPALYPPNRTLSPITATVVDGLRTIADRGPELADDVFMKVGASATVSAHFLHCFGGDPGRIELDGRDHLQDTIDHFQGGEADGTDPFRRESNAAVVGRSAGWAITGNPSPMDRELAALSPRFAIVMYGTNDIQLRNIDDYAENMANLADSLIARGTIPVMTSIMPRDDDDEADARVPLYNAVVRGLAQARQVPFIDYHRELLPLTDHGISGDGIHPTVYRANGSARACDFTRSGLSAGYNIRNLLTIETLDRVRRGLDGLAPDAAAPALRGVGSPDDPFVVDVEALPFTDTRTTLDGPFRRLARYAGCAADQDESGPEFIYRLDVDAAIAVRAMVFDRGDIDIDVHLLDATASEAGCIDRDHRTIDASLEDGTYYFALDTFVSRDGTEHVGEYLFVIAPLL